MDDGVVITESRPSDVLAALHESAHAEREYLFAARDAEPDDLILVAWVDGEAVGYIAVTDQRSDGVLVWEHLVVPAHRGRGLGERLLMEAVRRTVPGAVLEIDPLTELDYERVADYYRKLGFIRESARGGVWATAADLMREAARRQGAGAETQTPVSAVLGEKSPGVLTLPPDSSVAEALSVFNKHQVGAVIVSTDGSRIEGMLSERDVLVGLDEQGAAFLSQPVGEVTTKDVVTCTTHDPIASVMETMTNRRLRHLPVSATGRLVGIVSVGDLVHHRLGQMATAGD